MPFLPTLEQRQRARRVWRRVWRRARRQSLHAILPAVPAPHIVEAIVHADGTDDGARECARAAQAFITPTAHDVVAKYFDGLILNGRQGDDRWLADFEWLTFPTRSVITKASARVPKEVAPRLRSGKFQVSFDTDFEEIIAACADGRSTWITEPLIEVYRQLDSFGLVSTVAVRHEEQLAAGGWGLSIGGCFCGMSMFHRVSKAGGVALGALVHDLLTNDRLTMIDCIVQTPHSERFGAHEVDAATFKSMLVTSLERYSTPPA